MRTLSNALQTAYGGAVQKPAWLVEINFPTVRRYSSHGNVTWNSLPWASNDVGVASLRVDALAISGSLEIGNADGVFGGYVLQDGIADRSIRIWGWDASIGSTPAIDDPQLLVDGVGASARISETKVTVGIRHACEFRVGPRSIVNNSYGFTTLIPAGRTLTINGVSFVLQRGR